MKFPDPTTLHRLGRFVSIAPFALAAALLSGCSTTKTAVSESAEQKAERLSFWKPHLLLTSASRHPSLEVEIDWVEGAKPTEAEVSAFEDAFRKGCSKPDGVSVRLDDEIPKADAIGKRRKTLAALNVDGPDDTNAAFAYVLFYDSKLAGIDSANPIAMRAPYPFVILVDRNYLRSWTRLPGGEALGRVMMAHEAAHLMGLTSNRSHGDGMHCVNRFCLLNATASYRPFRYIWFGRVIPNRELCADCSADLESSREKTPDPKLRMRGLYCIRSEADYQVVSSPGYVYVHAGSLETLDFRELDRMRRAHFSNDPPDHDGEFFQSGEWNLETASKLIPRLRQDPLGSVRDLADVLQRKLDALNGAIPAPGPAGYSEQPRS